METGVLQSVIKGHQGQDVPFEVPYIAFPTTTGRIIIHAPGTGEPSEGRRGRYKQLGEALAAAGIASLVSFSPPQPDEQYKYPTEPYSFRDASWNLIFVQAMARIVVKSFKEAAVRAVRTFLQAFVGSLANLVVELRIQDDPSARHALDTAPFVIGVATVFVWSFEDLDCLERLVVAHPRPAGEVLNRGEPGESILVFRGQQRQPDNPRVLRFEPDRRIEN